jgi:hypothetical protein
VQASTIIYESSDPIRGNWREEGIPGKPVADGKRDRRTPSRRDVLALVGQLRSPQESDHLLCNDRNISTISFQGSRPQAQCHWRSVIYRIRSGDVVVP